MLVISISIALATLELVRDPIEIIAKQFYLRGFLRVARIYIIVRKAHYLREIAQKKVYKTGDESSEGDIEIPLEKVLEVLHSIRGMVAKEH